MVVLGLRGLALEWPADLAPMTGMSLAGETLPDHPLLWLGDGRITAGHLAVLRERAAAGPLGLTLLDETIAAAQLAPDCVIAATPAQHAPVCVEEELKPLVRRVVAPAVEVGVLHDNDPAPGDGATSRAISSVTAPPPQPRSMHRMPADSPARASRAWVSGQRSRASTASRPVARPAAPDHIPGHHSDPKSRAPERHGLCGRARGPACAGGQRGKVRSG